MLRPTEPYAGNGTFLVGTVHATLSRLVDVFGPPNEEDDGDYGPGWVLEDDWGNVVTVYGRHGCSHLSHVWHVGGHWQGAGEHKVAVWAHLRGLVAMDDNCPVCFRDWRERCDCVTYDGNISRWPSAAPPEEAPHA